MKKFAVTALTIFTISAVLPYSSALAAKKKYRVDLNKKEKEIKFDINNGFADLTEKLLPVTVTISTALEEKPTSTIDQILSQQKEKELSEASGVIIDKDGTIVTNYHVIKNAQKITVIIDDSKKYNAIVTGVDSKTDLALIKIDSEEDLPFAKFADSTKSRIGDWVIIIGNPYGLGKSVSTGIISAKSSEIRNGRVEEFIQTDAAMNSGNSGGPMFNTKGEIIGINKAIFSPAGGNVGIGFAIPSSVVSPIIKQLKEYGIVERGSLGISIQKVNKNIAKMMDVEEGEGVFVTDVIENQSAAKAGIIASDIILEFNGEKISDIASLPKLVENFPLNQTAEITILRNGKKRKIDVLITKNDNKIIAGISVVKKDDKILISNIKKGSEAEEKQIMIGDIITMINQEEVTTINQLKEEIKLSKNSDSNIALTLVRGDYKYFVTLKP